MASHMTRSASSVSLLLPMVTDHHGHGRMTGSDVAVTTVLVLLVLALVLALVLVLALALALAAALAYAGSCAQSLSVAGEVVNAAVLRGGAKPKRAVIAASAS